MSFDTLMAAADVQIFRGLGQADSWYHPPGGAPAVAVMPIPQSADLLVAEFGAQSVAAGLAVMIRAAEVGEISSAGRLSFGGQVYRIASARRADGDRLVWLVQLAAAK
ncbi:MAG: hypothetical protein J0H82_04535 [Alphaproteobacteria bacterium]|jgi:hypothetical protein|nr:hypothetical protein [Alphaproteobacteria bacterium]